MNEPAFPYSRLGSDADGMTLRDYFAAKAMHALLTRDLTLFYDPTSCAGVAYDIADAMLKARQK